MRNMSFMLTPDQILNRTKTVTRRMGWASLQPGTLVRAVRKGMGLKKGEKVEQLAVIRIKSVSRERLTMLTYDVDYGGSEVVKEGLAGHPLVEGSPHSFVDFFVATHRCDPEDTVTRIEFEYV
jgi:hypothetical protein